MVGGMTVDKNVYMVLHMLNEINQSGYTYACATANAALIF
jgi:Na+/H+ antiporter NhaA